MKKPQTYHLAIDWRRAKFFTDHSDIAPAVSEPVTVPEVSFFLSCSDICNALAIRDWLHAESLRYHLLGCYESLTNFFAGIVFVFDTVGDLLLFRQRWEPVKSLVGEK